MKQPETLSNKSEAPTAVRSSAWLGVWSITLNAGMVVAAWLAVNGNVPCGYVTKFLAGMTVALSPLVIVALIKPEPPAKLREVVSHITNALTVSICVWHGWLWCAAAFSWGWLLCCILFAARKAHAAKTPNDGADLPRISGVSQPQALPIKRQRE